MTSHFLIMVAIIIYLGGMMAIGIIYSKRNKSTDDFYLGGRKLGPLVTAMSAEASDMSSWLLMGLPGLAYLFGIAEASWTAIGLAIGTYVNWLIVAKRIRRYSHSLNAITIPDFFSKRYGDKNNILTLIAAIIIIVFFIPYTASGFAACGKLFSSLFGVNYMAAMIVSAAIILGYCVLGGFLAASTTDFVQSIVMTVGLLIVVIFGITIAGGFNTVINNAGELAGYLSLKAVHIAEGNTFKDFSLLQIVSTLAWGLGYFGMPHILLRFMAIEKEEKLTLSRRVASVWVVISLTVAIFIGVVGYSMSKVGAIPMLEGSSRETVIIEIANYLSGYGAIPALIAGVIMAGILAATMSTADSQLLAAASGVSQNLFKDFFKVRLSEKASMNIARGTVIVISILAVYLARNPDSSVFDIVSFAWAGFGATFGPVVLAALFWKRSNKWGALAGMVVGGVMVFLWHYKIAPLGGILAIYELLPAFIAAFIAIIVISLITKAPDEAIVEEFNRNNN